MYISWEGDNTPDLKAGKKMLNTKKDLRTSANTEKKKKKS